MQEKAVIKYALGLPEAEEDYPFGPQARVFKVRGKMFALLGHREWQGVADVAMLNLKSDPNEALMLRDIFPAILPGYHMNKKHWNSVMLDGSVPPAEVTRMIDRSYALVVRSLPKAQRQSMEIRWGEQKLYR